MLEMIFANSDFPEYYNTNSSVTREVKKQNNYNYRVNVEEYDLKYTEEECDIGYGYYVDLDISTPPKLNRYSKNKHGTTNATLLKLPQTNNYTVSQAVNYLPPIVEENYTHGHHHTTNKTKSYGEKSPLTSETSSVISGVTFCATVAFYYFFRSIRNNN